MKSQRKWLKHGGVQFLGAEALCQREAVCPGSAHAWTQSIQPIASPGLVPRPHPSTLTQGKLLLQRVSVKATGGTVLPGRQGHPGTAEPGLSLVFT